MIGALTLARMVTDPLISKLSPTDQRRLRDLFKRSRDEEGQGSACEYGRNNSPGHEFINSLNFLRIISAHSRKRTYGKLG
jgi:hypothetical protein